MPGIEILQFHRKLVILPEKPFPFRSLFLALRISDPCSLTARRSGNLILSAVLHPASGPSSTVSLDGGVRNRLVIRHPRSGHRCPGSRISGCRAGARQSTVSNRIRIPSIPACLVCPCVMVLPDCRLRRPCHWLPASCQLPGCPSPQLSSGPLRLAALAPGAGRPAAVSRSCLIRPDCLTTRARHLPRPVSGAVLQFFAAAGTCSARLRCLSARIRSMRPILFTVRILSSVILPCPTILQG